MHFECWFAETLKRNCNREESMVKSARKGGLLVLVLAAVAAMAPLLVACSSADESTTTSAAATSSGITASSGEPQRLVVGGKTAEEYEAALPDLERAVEAAPEDLAALQELAIAQYNTGRYEAAATTYLTMLELKDDGFTHNNYGNVLRDWEKLDEAKVEYEKAISTDPTLVTAYVNLASVLAAEGSTSEAVAVLDRGLAAVTGEDKERLESFKERLTGATTTT
jgi:Tfp pilus assembly protein PilF